MWKCFLVEPSDIEVISCSATWDGCSRDVAYGSNVHIGRVKLYEGTSTIEADNYMNDAGKYGVYHTFTCEFCGAIKETFPDSFSRGCKWIRKDTGEVQYNLHDFDIGAMWFAYWFQIEAGIELYGWDWENQFQPPLFVKTPDGDWNIDSRSSNCALLLDNKHRCWVRTGTVPEITVSKNGLTCSAGAGSIARPNWHGMLENGYLRTC